MKIKMIAAIAGAAVTLFITALPCSAAYREQPVDIKLAISIEGNGSGEFSKIIVESMDGPEEDRVLLVKEGKTSELTITMEEPGCRTYRIYQLEGDREDTRYDKSIYTAVLFAWTDDDGLHSTVVLQKDHSSKKPPEVVFCNKKIEEPGVTVKTGDENSAILWSGVGLAAAAAGGLLLTLMKRGRER